MLACSLHVPPLRQVSSLHKNASVKKREKIISLVFLYRVFPLTKSFWAYLNGTFFDRKYFLVKVVTRFEQAYVRERLPGRSPVVFAITRPERRKCFL